MPTSPRNACDPWIPSTKPDENSLFTRVNSAPYRDDDQLSYEEVDWQLQDLLAKMLIKNPEKRIRLRDVKRHPWVTHGLQNVIGWLEDTDPKARTSGKKIQVNEKRWHMQSSPSPSSSGLSPMSRGRLARSCTGAIGRKVLRADAPPAVPPAPLGTSSRTTRVVLLIRAKAAGEAIRGDTDYFATLTDTQPYNEHPLTQSVTASPREPADQDGEASAAQQFAASAGAQPIRHNFEALADFYARDTSVERQAATFAAPRRGTRRTHARSVTNAFLSPTPSLRESQTVPPSPSPSPPLPRPARRPQQHASEGPRHADIA